MTGSVGLMKPPRRFSTADVIAGISVAAVLIPQSLAYAEIAGLPPYFGLYAAALPPIAMSLLASSPYLQTGPVAMTSLLTFGALSVIAAPGSPEYIALAALLAIMVGLVRFVLGSMRAGSVVYLMSQPVLMGFTAAAGILIVSSQLPTALGVDAGDGALLEEAWNALIHPSAWDATSVVLAIVTVLAVIGGRRISRVFPGVLLAVAIGIAYSAITDYTGSTVGDVPTGLPPFSLDLPWSRIDNLLIGAVVIALVGFAEPAAISRTFAAQDRERWDPNREFLASGLANVASGVSGGFPVGGSFSRTSVNRLAGARTRWAGTVTGLTVLAFLPVAGVLSPLPRAILGAIVISAVASLVRIDHLVTIFRQSIPQGAVASITFVATLVMSPRIDQAVLLGIGAGIIVHLWRELRTLVMVSAEGTTLTLKPAGVMFFGSSAGLQDALLVELAEHPDATALVLDLSRLGRIDYTGAWSLVDMIERARQAGLHVSVESVPAHARRILSRVMPGDVPALQQGSWDRRPAKGKPT